MGAVKSVSRKFLLTSITATCLAACGSDDFSGSLDSQLRDKMKMIDAAYAVEVDTFGDVYVSGSTRPGLKHVRGISDILLYKYSRKGELVWGRQIAGSSGTHDFDRPTGIAIFPSTGDVYVSGFTTGAMSKNAHLGGRDAVLVKYDYNGKMLWSKQFGSAGHDVAHAVTTDSTGNVYITGYRDAIAGDQLSKGYRDIFVTKFDDSGKQLWQQIIGTALDDVGHDIMVGADEAVYVAGYSVGNLAAKNAGGKDAVILKLDAAGKLEWTYQYGSVADDVANSLVNGDVGQFYVAGTAANSMPQQRSHGLEDGWVAKFTSDGQEQWTRQFGNQYANRIKNVTFEAKTRQIVVVGEQEKARDQGQIIMAAFDAAGEQKWLREMGDAAAPSYDSVGAAGYFEKGKTLYVVGRSMPPKGPSTGMMFARVYK